MKIFDENGKFPSWEFGLFLYLATTLAVVVGVLVWELCCK